MLCIVVSIWFPLLCQGKSLVTSELWVVRFELLSKRSCNTNWSLQVERPRLKAHNLSNFLTMRSLNWKEVQRCVFDEVKWNRYSLYIIKRLQAPGIRIQLSFEWVMLYRASINSLHSRKLFFPILKFHIFIAL